MPLYLNSTKVGSNAYDVHSAVSTKLNKIKMGNTEVWTGRLIIPSLAVYPTASVLFNDEIHIFSYNAHYVLHNNVWTQKNDVPNASSSNPAEQSNFAIYNNELYFFDCYVGKNLYKYNASNDSWSVVASRGSDYDYFYNGLFVDSNGLYVLRYQFYYNFPNRYETVSDVSLMRLVPSQSSYSISFNKTVSNLNNMVPVMSCLNVIENGPSIIVLSINNVSSATQYWTVSNLSFTTITSHNFPSMRTTIQGGGAQMASTYSKGVRYKDNDYIFPGGNGYYWKKGKNDGYNSWVQNTSLGSTAYRSPIVFNNELYVFGYNNVAQFNGSSWLVNGQAA